MLEEPVSRIRQIYDVIEKSSPDYDAETIYKQLCEKEELLAGGVTNGKNQS